MANPFPHRSPYDSARLALIQQKKVSHLVKDIDFIGLEYIDPFRAMGLKKKQRKAEGVLRDSLRPTILPRKEELQIREGAGPLIAKYRRDGFGGKAGRQPRIGEDRVDRASRIRRSGWAEERFLKIIKS